MELLASRRSKLNLRFRLTHQLTLIDVLFALNKLIVNALPLPDMFRACPLQFSEDGIVTYIRVITTLILILILIN